jgi:predicted RNase H-like HicB family nuclease
MPQMRIPLRVVFYKDDGAWVAHCLEFNLMGDGATQASALQRLDEAITQQVDATLESGNWSNLFNPAPGMFLKMFAAGKDVAHGELHVNGDSLDISGMTTREYLGDAVDDLACV